MDVHLRNFARDLDRVLRAERLPCRHVVQTRMKTPRSIATKAAKAAKAARYRPVRDQLGARIIYLPTHTHARTHPSCNDSHALAYRIAGTITRRFPHTRLTRDYIRHPKPATGYRSLHLVVHLPSSAAAIEVQIRDLDMHLRAELDSYHDGK